MHYQHVWAVILAGGDGTRLQPLTRLISGDTRPKQFCPIFSQRTLLAETRTRLAPVVAQERTLFAVRKVHERYWCGDLADVDRARILVQSRNRGTAAGITCGVLQALVQDKDSTICVVPSDHHYDDDAQFQAAMRSAIDAAETHPTSVILLGGVPSYPETEYGWIQPGDSSGCSPIMSFREKPSLEVASDLLARGFLWNTFVMAGRCTAFLELLESCVPQFPAAFRSILRWGIESRRSQKLFNVLDPVDFSHQVLSRSTDRLKVVRLENVRWSDLGKPDRVMATLAEAGIQPEWAKALAKKATA